MGSTKTIAKGCHDMFDMEMQISLSAGMPLLTALEVLDEARESSDGASLLKLQICGFNMPKDPFNVSRLFSLFSVLNLIKL